MASPLHFLNSAVNDVANEDSAEQTPPRPLSGPGTSRQTRRLQLRNAGFKAAAVPSRKVTPKSLSTSTNWSSLGGMQGGSDVENMSPSGAKGGSLPAERRRSSGILQEIDNATLTRPKRTRPRVPSAKFFDPAAESYDAAFTSPMSPPPPRSSIKARSVKTRTKVNPKGRRSVSGEARMYIDHLEAELASAQSQLSAINSPTVTREQSSKLRTLNAEARQLQEEVAEWETKYEQRVQDEIDRHCEIESGLRAQVRKLEDDAEEAKYRVEELETQLDSAKQTLEAVETANINLEKRLEIMSELLAASPTKIDLHADTPGLPRRHQRPKSMLPRFPTASSLMHSPEKQSRTQPTSPLLTFSDIKAAGPEPVDSGQLTLGTASSQSDIASDAESVFSEAPVSGDSMTSAEQIDGMPSFNPWTLQALQSAKSRPARRMRRFGAGSGGPKPLILPSTSHCEQMPVSAPPLERSETAPAFAFPFSRTEEDLPEEDDSPSSMASRRRASTTADETTLAKLAASPFLQLPQHEEVGEDSMLSVVCPNSTASQMTSRNFSSLGSVAGRNLMEELCAVRSNATAESMELPADVDREEQEEAMNIDSPLLYGKAVEEGVDIHSILSAETSPSQPDRPSPTMSVQLRHQATTNSRPASLWDRLRLVFGDLWRSPVTIARHLVQTAQARMRIPEPLRNVQWWLVGVLLGPMARRRMLAGTSCCTDEEQRPLLQPFSPPADENDGLVYGTMHHTPPASPKRTNSIQGKGKKRVGCKRSCMHLPSKHSPWMWIKFSVTLAFAVGVAFKDGPGSLLRATVCGCRRPEDERKESAATEC